MKIKAIISISVFAISSSLFAANSNTLPHNNNHALNASKFVEFNPDNSQSFYVYERGTVVSYNGNEYKAVRAIDNNQTPTDNSAWKKINLSA